MTRASIGESLSISSKREFTTFLADSNPSPYPGDSVTAEWWKVLEGAALMKFTLRSKKENSVPEKWARLKKKVSTLTRGRRESDEATNLAIQHWLEALDVRHRYGHNLQIYHEAWKRCDTKEEFFHWLDSGEGKDLDLEECPRSKLQKEQIIYLGPKERKQYEVVYKNEKFQYRQSKKLLEGDKLIFVVSTKQRLYAAVKQKGKFQHSSFLAGGPALAAGRLTVKEGVLETLEAHSGHYRPTEMNFKNFVKLLSTTGVDLNEKMIGAVSHDDYKDRVRSMKLRQNSLVDDGELRAGPGGAGDGVCEEAQ